MIYKIKTLETLRSTSDKANVLDHIDPIIGKNVFYFLSCMLVNMNLMARVYYILP